MTTTSRMILDAATAPANAVYLTVDHEDCGDAFFDALADDVTCSVYEAKIRTLTNAYGRVMFLDLSEDADVIAALKALPGADEQLVWLDADDADGRELV